MLMHDVCSLALAIVQKRLHASRCLPERFTPVREVGSFHAQPVQYWLVGEEGESEQHLKVACLRVKRAMQVVCCGQGRFGWFDKLCVMKSLQPRKARPSCSWPAGFFGKYMATSLS